MEEIGCTYTTYDVKIDSEVITFLNIPKMLVVKRGLSETGHEYFTILSLEACEYIHKYLARLID